MRASFTSRPSRALASAAAAPPVVPRAPESASHPACQLPAPRSCSPASDPTSTDAWPRTSAAPALVHMEPTGLCFCGIADEPPASPPSRTSPTSVCARSCTSSAILASDAGSDLERGTELGDADPVRMPRHGRLGEPELPGEERRDLDAPVAERRQGPRRPAKLRRETIPKLAKAVIGVEHADEPPGGLQPEGRRNRLLEQRPSCDRGVAVCSGERGACGLDPLELVAHEPEPVARDQDERGVHHVLARRPEVHPPRVLLPDARDKGAHERLGGSAGAVGLGQQLIPVVPVGGAGGRDRRRRLRGDHARGGARAREHPLDLEHRPEPRASRGRLAKRGRDEQRVERGHTAKNVVCAGPWRRMSNRTPPSWGTATRVSRWAAERRESTGSAALASTSSGK